MKDAEKRSENENPVDREVVHSACSQWCFNGWMTFSSHEGERVFCPYCNPEGKFII